MWILLFRASQREDGLDALLAPEKGDLVQVALDEFPGLDSRRGSGRESSRCGRSGRAAPLHQDILYLYIISLQVKELISLELIMQKC